MVQPLVDFGPVPDEGTVGSLVLDPLQDQMHLNPSLVERCAVDDTGVSGLERPPPAPVTTLSYRMPESLDDFIGIRRHVCAFEYWLPR